MHYAFDHWMKRNYSENPWCRYADDGLVHCRTQSEAERMLVEIGKRFNSCGLELHPDKTKIIYCKDGARKGKHENKSFDFLGYTFKARMVKVKSRNSFFIGFTPVVSLKAVKSMTQKLRRGNWRNNTTLSLQELADSINPMLRGWLNYYGKYNRSSMYRVWRGVNNMLLSWAKKKYKSLKNSRTKAGKLLERIHKKQPGLFIHWREGMFGAFT